MGQGIGEKPYFSSFRWCAVFTRHVCGKKKGSINNRVRGQRSLGHRWALLSQQQKSFSRNWVAWWRRVRLRLVSSFRSVSVTSDLAIRPACIHSSPPLLLCGSQSTGTKKEPLERFFLPLYAASIAPPRLPYIFGPCFACFLMSDGQLASPGTAGPTTNEFNVNAFLFFFSPRQKGTENDRTTHIDCWTWMFICRVLSASFF